MSRAMKDSGVPWLKEIPVDWKVERGKNVLALQKRPVRDNDEVVTCFRDGEVILRSLRRTEGFTMSDKEIGYQGINEGDIVIHGMDGFAGAMGVSKSTGKASPVLIVCTPKYDAIPQYIIYYLRALAMTDVFVALATGIRERSCDLRWNKVSELEFIMPSSSEQQAIVEFLDRKCAEVDEMIALQEQIIEELRAYKQSVITEAVTKGLNQAAPMRDSGIEWIGSIPEHWEVKRLKNVADLNPTFNAQIEQDTLVAYMPMECLRNGIIQERIASYSEIASYTPFKDGDVVMAKVTPCFENGNIAVANNLQGGYGFGTSEIFVIRCCKEAHNKYAFYYLQSAYIKNLGVSSMTGTGGLKRVNPTILNNSYFISPSVAEQQAIADYLDEKCADIDSLIQTKQSKIDSLKEYKKSIIYEYVTGKKEIA